MSAICEEATAEVEESEGRSRGGWAKLRADHRQTPVANGLPAAVIQGARRTGGFERQTPSPRTAIDSFPKPVVCLFSMIGVNRPFEALAVASGLSLRAISSTSAGQCNYAGNSCCRPPQLASPTSSLTA